MKKVNLLIKYDYLIERDEGDEVVSYTPGKLPQTLPSLVYIEGPNSSGKSTLLHILAAGFNGHKRKDINDSLKNKVISIMDSKYQKVSFSFELDDDESKLVFSKLSDENHITRSVIKNGKIANVGKDQVEEYYNLIYDIPENPIGRLKELNRTLKFSQIDLNTKFSNMRAKISEVLVDVKNSQDPEKISALNEKIESRRVQLEKLKSDLEKDKKEYEYLTKFFYTKFYRKHQEQVSNLKKSIELESKKSKQVSVKANKELNKIESIALNYRCDLKNESKNLSGLLLHLGFDSNLLGLWNQIDFDNIFIQFLIPESVMSLTKKIKAELSVLKKKISNDKVQKVNIWNELIEVLEKYEKNNYLLPGISSSIGEYLPVLRAELEKDVSEFKRAEIIDEALENTSEIEKMLDNLKNSILSQYKSLKRNTPEYQEGSLDVAEMRSKLVKIEQMEKKYSKLCVESNVNLSLNEDIQHALSLVNLLNDSSIIKVYGEEKAEEKISAVSKEILNLTTKISLIETQLIKESADLENMKTKKQHRFHGNQEKIENLVIKLQEASAKMATYDTYITEVISGDDLNIVISSEKKKYYESVSLYLGKQLKIIRHIDGTHNVKKVDFVSKSIETDLGKLIRFDDMGTGQSQSAYLLGRLNSLDDRKVIVLLDEIAMMDKASLEPIIDKLKSLKSEKKLIAAVIVQKAEVVQAKSFEEIYSE